MLFQYVIYNKGEVLIMIRLREIRNQKGYSQVEIAKILGISQPAYANYERGARQADYNTLSKLAEIFGCSIDYLLGRTSYSSQQNKGVKIPVLGRVQAGIPVEAVEDILDWEEIPQEMVAQGEFFALKIRGNSMLPRIVDGDVVIIRKQSDIDNGDIAVVLVGNNDATVKKIRKTENGIELVPLNPNFDIQYYSNEEIEALPLTVIGKVVELRGKL